MSHVLTLNAGSSSLKFGLFETSTDPVAVLTGLIDQIGGDATIKVKDAADETLAFAELSPEQAANHVGAVQASLDQIATYFPEARIQAVGHRIVHGGAEFSAPVEITDDVLGRLESFVPLAPLHQPHNLAGIAAAIEAFPEARQVACFDTAFHRQHSFVQDTYGLPRAYYDKGVRRYGFHGSSYEFISGAVAEIDPALHAGRVAVAHLGNGASICGIHCGKSVASTMGFSPLDGVAMGTRPGQIDPGVLLYLMSEENMSAAQISDLLYTESGLLGLSGISNDMRSLLASDAVEAAQAIDYFCTRIRMEIGSLAAAMQGLDGLVFTGGIGENAAAIRAQICASLGWLGIELDDARNAAPDPRISTDNSPVPVMVIPTNEELVIARAAANML